MIKRLVVMFSIGLFVSMPLLAGNKTIVNPLGIGSWNDLSTPTSARKYPIGMKIVVFDDSNTAMTEYTYIQAPIALTAYGTYAIEISTTSAGEVRCKLPTVTLTANAIKAAVPQIAFTKDYYGFVATEGLCSVVNTTSTVLGNTGRIQIGLTTVKDTGDVTISSTTVGMFTETTGVNSTQSDRGFYLFGKWVGVALAL